jgi:adenylosuccinate synthase
MNGRVVTEFPANLAGAEYEAVYETLPGWKEPTRGARDFDELPTEAKDYIARLEQVSGVPCTIISTGSDRDETIIRRESIASRWLHGSH